MSICASDMLSPSFYGVRGRCRPIRSVSGNLRKIRAPIRTQIDKKHASEGLAVIHPFGNFLAQFRKEAMPDLKREVPMYQDFPSYLNSIYETLKMGYVPFDKNNNYISPSANLNKVKLTYNWYKQKCELLRQSATSANQQLA